MTKPGTSPRPIRPTPLSAIGSYTRLENLPAKERTAILLFYLEGYSVKEVADIVDASQVAVRQQLSRGREHLRKLLETTKI